MKKLLTSVVLAGALFALPKVASAANGYVCHVVMYNYSGLGTSGGLLITFYTGANCTGSFAYTGYYCSASATSNVCASSSYWTYSQAQLVGLLGEFGASARAGRSLYYSNANACKTSGSTCLGQVNFQ
jgi:hypothetical protein